MKTPSSKQQKIITFIRHFGEERGYPPSIRDIVSGCGLSSTSVASYNLRILEKEGFIRRHNDIARGIELVSRDRDGQGLVEVPIIGQIAAGKPVPVPTPDTWDVTGGAEMLAVSRSLTRGRDGLYALKVKGWSMVDALVNDGDVVLMQNVSVVDNGEMAAVWLKSERKATLKRVYGEPGRVRLQPANSTMQPIYTAPDNVTIQGRVIAVIRQVT